MKLSKETIAILKNFSRLNPGIYIKSGSSIKTLSDNGTSVAMATVKENFPKSFAIAHMNKFLSIQDLFTDPEFEFKDTEVEIFADKRKLKYAYADPAVIIGSQIVDKDTTQPEPEISFDIKKEDIVGILDAASKLELKQFCIRSTKDGKIQISTFSNGNTSAGEYSVELGETEKDFLLVVDTDKFCLLEGDYKVSCIKKVGKNGSTGVIIDFENKSMPVRYWVGASDKSYFN